MRSLIARRAWVPAVGLLVGLLVALLAVGRGWAADLPAPIPPTDPSGGKVIQVQDIQPPPPTSPLSSTPSIPAPPSQSPLAPGPNIPNPGTSITPTVPINPASAETSIPVAQGQASQVLNATNLGQLFDKSAASTGVQTQQRNALVTDPRVRGLRSYQYVLNGDNALFTPVRLDLDTPVTRFDPGVVRDVGVVKGPYSVMYGPALAVLNVSTLDAPRFEQYEAHGRTALTYQTNGERWNGLQSVWAGDATWGARVTYNGLTGNDYQAGNGQDVPSSFLSHNVNWAIGLDLSDKSSVEFKGLRVTQSNIEYPGLYFDVASLDTEAYSLRYTLRDQGFFDRLVLDTWYNTTVGTGDTRGGAKQAFVQDLLAVSFNPNAFRGANGFYQYPLAPLNQVAAVNGPGNLNLFRDLSTSQFATTSLGYRLFADWGTSATGRLTVGTDLRVIGQGLQENIQFQQISGRNLNTGGLISATGPATFTQNQSIPDSNSTNPGLFAETEVPLTDRLTFRAGGRTDWVGTSSHDRTITGNIDLFGPPGPLQTNRLRFDPIIYSERPRDPNTDRNFFLLAGYLQSQYKLTDGLTAVAAVGHAERAPTLTELYAAGPFVGVLQQGTSRLIGDPHLKSEKLTQLDLGLQADYGWVRGGVTGFYGWLNDYITFDQNNGGPGLTQVVFTNTDLATLAGAEAFAQVDVTTWLTAFGTMTYVQGTDQTHADRRRAANLASSRRNDPATGQYAANTEPLPQIPPLESLIGLRIHDPREQRRWQAEFAARVVTGQNAIARSLGEFATPGFTVFSVRGYWQPTDRLLLTAGVENLGNKLYREHLDPISGNLLSVNPLFRPGTNFYFGTQVSY